MMNITLCCDDKYITPCLVCLTSIFENTREPISAYILTLKLSDVNVNKLESLALRYKQSLKCITIDDRILQKLKKTQRFPLSIYLRYFLPYVITDSKALYLDCDIIVNDSLFALWNIDITNYACGVVEDFSSDDVFVHNRIRTDAPYFNSGVLLMNLDYWRKNDVTNKLIETVEKYPDMCFYPDQDALNILLEGKVFFLDYRYNFQNCGYYDLSYIPLHFSKHKKLIQAKQSPIIIHFSGQLKPWHYECDHPMCQEFFKYAQIGNSDTLKQYHYYNLLQRFLMFSIRVSNYLLSKF